MRALTVLMPVFNHGRWLETSIKSVVAQTCFDDISVVVADDCSTDNSLDIALQAARNHQNIKVIANPKNYGILGNYASALKLIDSQYIAILEGDDFWSSPEKLSRQLAFMRQNPEVNGCFVEYFLYDEPTGDSFPAPPWSMGRYRKLSTLELLGSNPSATFSTCMYKTEVFRKALSQVDGILAADWLTNILVSLDSSFGFIPGPSVVYRMHGQGSWTGMSRRQQRSLQQDSLQQAMALLPTSFAPYIEERMSSIVAEFS
jgi:glycosyltransferase involved in cell wall biosynthesis